MEGKQVKITKILKSTKCKGCGVKIQTTEPNKPGYLREDVYEKNPHNFLCERCYNLQHYNKNIKIAIDEKEFLENAKKIAQTNALVVNVIDIFDLEGTVIRNINELFPNNKILMIANKFDLFLRSNRPTKIKRYVYDYLANKNIKTNGLIVASAKEEVSAKKIIMAIEKMAEGKDVYFFGTSNVGKSTLMNSIMYATDENDVFRLTVSNNPGTTLDVVDVKLKNGLNLHDTPGIMNKTQITSYLDNDSLNRVIPKKFIKPQVYQLNPKQSLFIGGLAIINFLEGEKSSFVLNFSNGLIIHRTKLANAMEFYNEHIDDILKIPTPEERERLGSLKVTKFDFDGKKEISISGLGFIGLTGKGKVSVLTFENVGVTMREPLI